MPTEGYPINAQLKKYKENKDVTYSYNKGIEVLKLGKGLLNIYIVARQHPGETIGSWMVEGLLKEYFNGTSIPPLKLKQIKNLFTITIVVMANPVGVDMGHWYTNKKGQNLNRSWLHNKTPEINNIKKIVKKDGVLYLDLHGDEGSMKHFITGCDLKNNSVYEFFNKKMNKFCPNYQLNDYYKNRGYKVYGTMDCFVKDKTLTIEGAMKHPIYKHKTIQDEGIEIGKAICKSIFDTHKFFYS